MTCRKLASFDKYATAGLAGDWTTTSGSPTIVAAAGRSGTACLRLLSASSQLVNQTFDAQATWVVGAAVKLSVLPGSAQSIFELLDAGTLQCDLRVNLDGTLSVTRNGTNLGTSVSALSAGAFFFIELKVLISDTVGTVGVWVNGASYLSLTGQDTKNTANASANQVKIKACTTTTDVDDLYIFDGQGSTCNNVQGDSHVQATFGIANGADTGWTLVGAASKWQAVAQNPPATANYISSAAAPDSYTALYAAPVSLGPIGALQISMSAEKDDVNATTIAPIVRHAGTDNVGTSVSPTNGSYLFFSQCYDINPGTGVAWTQTDIVTDEFGVSRVT